MFWKRSRSLSLGRTKIFAFPRKKNMKEEGAGNRRERKPRKAGKRVQEIFKDAFASCCGTAINIEGRSGPIVSQSSKIGPLVIHRLLLIRRSEKSGTQIQAVGCQEKQHKQTSPANKGELFETLGLKRRWGKRT